MDIFEMPYNEQNCLCNFLDGGQWMDLADILQVNSCTIKKWKKAASPSNELLKHLYIKNYKVNNLFSLLYKIKSFEGMKIIKNLVDKSYHRFLLEYEQQELEAKYKKLNIASTNFNDSKGVRDKKSPKSKDLVVSTEQNNQENKTKFPLSNTNKVPSISYVVETAGAIRQVSYEELKKATNDWHPRTVLGKGGFGIVFKGLWKCTEVAIKRIERKANNPESETEQLKQSINELHCLNAYRHDNILPLYAYSVGGPQPCLVYQFMSGGSLEYRLRKDPRNVLNWNTRMNIAISSARGLQYLHTIGDKPLIHGDIKTANILLDHNNSAKIGDFGLAREGSSQLDYIKVTRLHGTRAYLPEEFLRGFRLSTKLDTYSFGVVLMEVATGLSPLSDSREHKLLRDHVLTYQGDLKDLKDPRLPGGDDYYTALMEVGTLCVKKRARERPEMVTILVMLEEAMARIEKTRSTKENS